MAIGVNKTEQTHLCPLKNFKLERREKKQMVMNARKKNEAQRKLVRGGGREMAIQNRMVREQRLH